MNLRPMPLKYGIGFVSNEQLPENLSSGYRYEQSGPYHNYHVSSGRYHWPIKYELDKQKRIVDGFSPNMNKELHVGHLRNLALANSLSNIFSPIHGYDTKFVSLLGCSLGVKLDALKGWEKWTKFVNFNPDVYYDCALPQDLVKTRVDEDTSVEYWDGPYDPVIVRRSDGRYLYSFHDLSFASYVGPTHYITGYEQKDHFKSLGFEDKHYSMGLVLGDDGKKIKSRDGDAFSAQDAIDLLKENLESTPDSDKLAWNVLSWNCLQAKRDRNIQFEPDKWTKPDSAGMYITYTYARILSALGDAWDMNINSWGQMVGDDVLWRPDDPQDKDVELAGFAEQYNYFLHKSIMDFDPSPLAQFAHDLSRQLGRAYHSEIIRDGRYTFRISVMWAAYRLRCCMERLGMFVLEKV